MIWNFQPETLENIRHYLKDMKTRKEGRKKSRNKQRKGTMEAGGTEGGGSE